MIYIDSKPVNIIPTAMSQVSDEGKNLPVEKPIGNVSVENYASVKESLGRLGIKVTYRAMQSDNFVSGSVGWKLAAEGKIYAAEGYIGGWNINATTIYSDSNEIILDSANKKIESGNYVSGAAGAGFHLSQNLLEVGNIACRGLIRTAVFQKDIISSVGGNLMVLGSDVLNADMTAADNSTLTTKATTTFSVSDILRIKDGTDDEWLEVTAVSGADYTCNRDKAGDYGADANPAWKKGATVVNYGQSGDGGIFMTASESNAPYLSVFTTAGSPWTDLNTRLKIGNLNGYLGYTTDLYGIAIGETDYYLKYDPTNHLRIKGTITATAGEIGGWSIDSNRIYTAVLELNSNVNGGLIRFKEAGTTKVDSYWDVSSHYWGVYPSFGGYAYAGISMNVTDNRLALTHPGNSPYIQMGFFNKQITVNCDETTSQVDFYILPSEIRLSRDYIDLG